MGLLKWLLARFADPEQEGDEGTSRFVPSPLDRSVRIAHGGKEDEIERELTEIAEQARELDDDTADR